jgi:hypothetical protein
MSQASDLGTVRRIVGFLGEGLHDGHREAGLRAEAAAEGETACGSGDT